MKFTKLLILTIILTVSLKGLAIGQQSYSTRNAKVSFQSQTPIEEIYAENSQAASILKTDGSEKIIAFNVIMRSFKFEKALMEEHFNEKYVHSEKYPSAKFIGTLNEEIDLNKPGGYRNIPIKGKLTFHGTSKPVTVNVDLEVGQNNVINGHASFKIKPEHYNIEIPNLVRDKISGEILVTVDVSYKSSN